MARMLFAAWGTRGDTQAALTLAESSTRRGHQVRLAAPGFLADQAERVGVPFLSLGDDPLAWFDDAPRRRRADTRLLMPALLRLFSRQVEPQFRILNEAVDRVDVVIGQGLSYAAPSIAEAAGVPYLYASTNVFLLQSAEQPALGMNAEHLPAWVNRAMWRQFSVTYNLLFRRNINRHRARLGLHRITDVHRHVFDASRTIAVFDPELYPVPGDVVLPHPPVGSLAPPSGSARLDPRTESFLAEGRPVIFVGFGSMPDRAPERTTRMFVDAARQVGARLVISAGWAGLGEGSSDTEDHIVGDVSHTALFPRVDVVVHHGGVGTAAAAARAGKPQLIVPHAYDQHASARRIEAAGVGVPALPKRKLTSRHLAERLDEALNNEQLRRRAELIGRTISDRDASASALGIIEEAVAG